MKVRLRSTERTDRLVVGATDNQKDDDPFLTYRLGGHIFFCELKPLEGLPVGDTAKQIHELPHIFLKRFEAPENPGEKKSRRCL